MKTKDYWFGKEIEGRLYGLESVFLARDFDGIKNITNDFSHALIGTTLLQQLNNDHVKHATWEMFQDYLDSGNMITIEARPEQIKAIPQPIKLKAHILLWLDVPELNELKSSDSVKLCLRDHDMYVGTLHNLQRVTRNDYYHDRYE